MLLWAADGRLGDHLARTLEDLSTTVIVSAVTIWEIEIKRGSGRLEAPFDVIEMVDHSGFERLPVTFEHALAAGRLPAHHSDPFDRMLVAQAQIEQLTLVTADRAIPSYDVTVLDVPRELSGPESPARPRPHL